MVRPGALDKVLMPLGGLCKTEVRALAAQIGLPNAKKKDSVGLCFVVLLDSVDNTRDMLA